MKASHVARRRLHSLGLSTRPFARPEQVVAHHVAMQSQDYGPAKWSIGQRCDGLVDEDVDAALAEGSIIRTHVLRPTWHFIARDDARWLLALTGPLVQKQIGPRYRELGLDPRTLGRCEKVVASALEGGRHLTRKELGEALAKARIDTEGQRLPHILSHCELEAMICSGALAGKQHTYALFDERVGADATFDRAEAVVELTRRYLLGHGPATVKDLRWWSSLPIADIRGALQSLGSEVASATVDGVTLWWIETESTPARARRGADLLQTYDEFVVGYTESRWFGDPRADDARAAWRDRGVPGSTVLLDGAVCGQWKRSVDAKKVRLEVVTYEKLTSPQERALDRAAAELGRFLDRTYTLATRRRR